MSQVYFCLRKTKMCLNQDENLFPSWFQNKNLINLEDYIQLFKVLQHETFGDTWWLQLRQDYRVTLHSKELPGQS